MDHWLEKHNLLKLTQEEIKRLKLVSPALAHSSLALWPHTQHPLYLRVPWSPAPLLADRYILFYRFMSHRIDFFPH